MPGASVVLLNKPQQDLIDAMDGASGLVLFIKRDGSPNTYEIYSTVHESPASDIVMNCGGSLGIPFDPDIQASKPTGGLDE